MFHMITHAFFKALLFLGAGSVIVAMAHEQDMRRYGNLRKYLPITFVTFIIGWLAISGVPPFSGFWSKDEILAGAFNKGPDGPALWAVGLVTAVLTAFYMTRLVIMTFFGGTEHWRTPEPELLPEGGVDPDVPAAAHAHAAGTRPTRTTPTATTTTSSPRTTPRTSRRVHDGPAGGPGRPRRAGRPHEPALLRQAGAPGPVAGAHHRRRARAAGRRRLWILALLAIAGAVLGVFVAYRVYQQHKGDPARIEQPVLAHAWYIDDTYAKVVGGPGEAGFQGVADFDQHRRRRRGQRAWARAPGAWASCSGRVQTGLVRTYALGVAIGAGLLLAFVVTRMNV